MIALLQRVLEASVRIEGSTTGAIGQGLVVLIGFESDDTSAMLPRLLQRILGYRIFEDEAGRMNRSLADVRGGLLLVPQFTLAADTSSGMRPGFSTAATPADGARLFDELAGLAAQAHDDVSCGSFGAHMQVHLVNDGPATFWLQLKPKSKA